MQIGSWQDGCEQCSDPLRYDAPQIAESPSGDAVAAWAGDGALEVAVREHDGAWQAPLALSASSNGKPKVAINARGLAAVVWTEHGLDSATRQIGRGGWSTPLTIPGVRDAPQALAIDSRGDIAVTWLDYTEENEGGGIVFAAFKKAGAPRWSQASALTKREVKRRRAVIVTSARGPRVAFDGRGDALLVWGESVQEEPRRRQGVSASHSSIGIAVRRIGASHWSGFQYVATPRPENIVATGLAVSASGEAVAAWEGYGSADALHVTSSSTLDGRWRAPQTVATAARGFNTYGFGLPLGIDRRGEALLAYGTYTGGPVQVRVVAGQASTGHWQKPVLVGHGSETELAVNERGAAAVVWQRVLEAGVGASPKAEVIEATERANGGHWSSPVAISPRPGRGVLPSVALDERRHASFVWFERGGSVEASDGVLE